MSNLEKIAELIKEMNNVGGKIANIIGRPAEQGHVGEYIASLIFDIELNESASKEAFDGSFKSGSLKGSTVDVKWSKKNNHFLNVNSTHPLKYYLVLAGPYEAAGSSRGKVSPWVITSVFLFDAERLVKSLKEGGIKKIGIATSVKKEYWEAAEIYPKQRNQELILSEKQKGSLALFG